MNHRERAHVATPEKKRVEGQPRGGWMAKSDDLSLFEAQTARDDQPSQAGGGVRGVTVPSSTNE